MFCESGQLELTCVGLMPGEPVTSRFESEAAQQEYISCYCGSAFRSCRVWQSVEGHLERLEQQSEKERGPTVIGQGMAVTWVE